MKSHRASWKDRREFRAATAWWKVNVVPGHQFHARTRASIIKLNAVMSPRTDTLLKLFDKEQLDASKAKARALKEEVAKRWNERLKAAGPVKAPTKRKIIQREP